jgi:methionyl-tRNA formyltransferase
MSKTIAFYLMTSKGFAILQSYLKEFDVKSIEMVVIGKDKKITDDYSEKITELCKQKKIPFRYKGEYIEIQSGLSFAISWKWIIANSNGLIVLHDSLLPKYRGFAPVVNSLINGEKKLGVSAIKAHREYDKGDIYSQLEIEIRYPIKIQQAIELVTPLYYKLIRKIIVAYNGGKKLTFRKQLESKATYSLWRDEEDYRINWNLSAIDLRRFIDAVGHPYSGAFTYNRGKKIRVFSSEIVKDVKIENRTPGKVIFLKDKMPVVVCGKGLLKLTEMHDANINVVTNINLRTRFA